MITTSTGQPPFPCIIVDSETSGLDFHDFSCVLEIGAAYYDRNAVEQAAFSSLVKPIFPIDLNEQSIAKAMEVNQIALSALDEAPDSSTVWNALVYWSGLFGPEIPITAWPVRFDRNMMIKTWGIERVGPMPWGFCIKSETAALRPKGKKRMSLNGMAEEFGLKREGAAHRALSDARMTGAIWREVALKGRIVGDGTGRSA